MRSLVVFADLAHPASEPNACASPRYFSQGYTGFPKSAEESSVGFNMRNTRFFPLLSLLRDFYFYFSFLESRETQSSNVPCC